MPAKKGSTPWNKGNKKEPIRTLCLCGCGEYAAPRAKWIIEHYYENMKGENNQAKRPESRAKNSANRKGKCTGDDNPSRQPGCGEKISAALLGHVVSEETKKKISDAREGQPGHTWSEEEFEKKRQWQIARHQNINGYCSYKYYAPLLEPMQECRPDLDSPYFLQVPCKKCGEWFRPTSIACGSRYAAIYGKWGVTGESHLYCSDECKNTCEIFGKDPRSLLPKEKSDDDRPLQGQWRQLVLNEYGWNPETNLYECEMCDFTSVDGTGLIAHHWKPVRSDPLESADVDVGLVVCKECDQKVHHLPGCSSNSLSKCRS